MKLLIAATFTALVAAQTLDDLPACSKPCLQDGLMHAGCASSDVICACAHAQSISDDITPCLQSVCSDEALGDFTYLVNKICANAGVPIPPLADQMETEDKFVVPLLPTPYVRLPIPPDGSVEHSTTADPIFINYTVTIVPGTSPTEMSSGAQTLILTRTKTQTEMRIFTLTQIQTHTQTQTKTQTLMQTKTQRDTRTKTQTVAITPSQTPSASMIDLTTATSISMSAASTLNLPEFTSGVGSVRVGGFVAGVMGFVGLVL